MTYSSVIGRVSFLVLLSGTTPAFADLTADDVWAEWKSFSDGLDVTVAIGAEERSGNTLTLQDITFSAESNGGSSTTSISEIVLTENNDGTVSITLGPEYRTLMHFPQYGEDYVDVELVTNLTDFNLLASGTPEETSYSYQAQSIIFDVEKFVENGRELDVDITATLSSVEGTYAFANNDTTKTFFQNVIVDKITYVVNFIEPSSKAVEDINITGEIGDFSSESSLVLPNEFEADDFDVDLLDVLEKGFAINIDLGFATMSQAMNVTEGSDQIVTAQVGMDRGDFRFAVDLEKIGYAFSGENVNFEAHGSDKASSDTELVDVKAQIAKYSFTSSASLPEDLSVTDEELLQSGFGLGLLMNVSDASGSVMYQDGDEKLNARGEIAEAAIDFFFGAEGMKYSILVDSFDTLIESSSLPIPSIGVSLNESLHEVDIPILATDEFQDFKMTSTYRDLTLSEGIWDFVDQTANFPRDPLTAVLDVSGKARLLVDIMSPRANRSSAPPIEIQEIALNELEFSAVGASLTGNGDFTFDNSDLSSFDGIPKPIGALDFNLVGGNDLLDRLIAMGLIPESEAMGIRMMIGIFAKPGDGEDTLVSRIEFTEDGKVLANGQRLK